MKEKCIYKFDNIKVFLMILVIIAHTLINSYGDKGMEYIRFICLCYTMPLFTFISGLFIEKGAIVKKELHSSFIAMYYFYDNK